MARVRVGGQRRAAIAGQACFRILTAIPALLLLAMIGAGFLGLVVLTLGGIVFAGDQVEGSTVFHVGAGSRIVAMILALVVSLPLSMALLSFAATTFTHAEGIPSWFVQRFLHLQRFHEARQREYDDLRPGGAVASSPARGGSSRGTSGLASIAEEEAPVAAGSSALDAVAIAVGRGDSAAERSIVDASVEDDGDDDDGTRRRKGARRAAASTGASDRIRLLPAATAGSSSGAAAGGAGPSPLAASSSGAAAPSLSLDRSDTLSLPGSEDGLGADSLDADDAVAVAGGDSTAGGGGGSSSAAPGLYGSDGHGLDAYGFTEPFDAAREETLPPVTVDLGHPCISQPGPHDVAWCRKCSSVRPPRAHHCALCGRCVLKMDHHCPWVANCVGWSNYKSFYLLLLWGLITSITALSVWVPLLFSAWQPYQPVDAASAAAALASGEEPASGSAGGRRALQALLVLVAEPVFNALGGARALQQPPVPPPVPQTPAALLAAAIDRANSDFTFDGSPPAQLIGVIVTLSLGVSLLMFVGMHTHLLLTNQTTLESGSNRSETYTQGSWSNNWKAVMGASPRTWLWPFMTRDVVLATRGGTDFRMRMFGR